MTGPALTDDLFFGGRLRLLQPARGHRFGHDAALLAASVPAGARSLLDAGAGVGAAGLAGALRAPDAQATLLEIAPDLVALAARNAVRNGLGERARAIRADLLDPASRRAAGIAPESFALVLTNPPFLDAARARLSPDPARARAHAFAAAGAAGREGGEPLTRWLQACLACLAPGGELRVIHRADALGPLLAALEGRAGGVRLVAIRPRPGAPATRIVVAARKGSRAPLRLEPDVTLESAGGAPDSFAQAALSGRSGLLA